MTTEAPTAIRRTFDAVVARLWRLLPEPLRGVVPPTLIGFALINGFTFGVDLALLSLGYRVLGLPHPVAITIGYVCAFALAFFLNRTYNFHVHGDMGGQAAKYSLAVLINYVVIILGIGSALTALGVHFLVARVAASLVEVIWMYSSMRWWVFRR